MAGLKKKKKEKSGSPNVVLVVFLVLFVITSIGLGVWGYYGYAGQEVLRKQRLDASINETTRKTEAAYYKMLWNDTRVAIGEKLADDDKIEYEGVRDLFMQADFGPYKNEKTKETARKLIDDLKAKLGAAADNKGYDKNFKAELDAALAKIKDIEGKTNAEVVRHEKTKEMLAALTKDRDKFFEDALARIGRDNNTALAATKVKSEEFKQLTESLIKLNKELADMGEEKSKLEEDSNKKIEKMKRAIAILEAEKKENLALGGGPGAPAGGGGGSKGDLFPLLLDISPGKPLWDQPVGKITRVDLDLRQVTINLGSAQGAKPELTFNVFGPNLAGRAEKQMKGTIEIIKVDLNSSQCRITSLYDSEGVEILMGLKTQGRILRETDLPIRDGDLLFNLFWGTRVAVAGYVSVTGEPVLNPAEQFSQMDDFMAFCRRNGMLVDAWVDMRTGKIQGKITSKTRYLIRGEDLARPGKDARPMKKDDDKEMEKEPAKEGAADDRIDLVNKSNWMLRNEAKEKGMLLISAENFANVIGYRRARSANSVELSGFRPTLPYAGAPQGGGVIVLPERPREEPKEMEKKDMEKKDPGN